MKEQILILWEKNTDFGGCKFKSNFKGVVLEYEIVGYLRESSFPFLMHAQNSL